MNTSERHFPGNILRVPGAAVLASALAVAAPALAEDTPIRVAGAPGEPAAEEAAPPTPVAAETPATADEREHQLRVRLLGTAAFTDGDTAQFQQRHRVPENFSGGIDEVYYETEIAEDTELEVEGRAIFDNHDYLLRLGIRNDDKGFLDVGYKQFRTWYDGRGGYHRPTDVQFVVFDPELALDREEAWLRGGVVLPQHFELTVGYRYLTRDGRKNSVAWGDSSALGLPPPNAQRDIVPAFYDIDEERHLLDVTLVRETEKLQVGAGGHYEHTDIDNRRNVVRSPGQPAERRFTQRDASEADVWGARMFGTARLFENKVTFSGAYAYNDLDLDLGGSRVYGAAFDASFDSFFPARQQRDEGFLDLEGRTELREHVGSLALSVRPVEDFQMLSALRVRGETREGRADFLETNVGASPDFVTAVEEFQTRSEADEMSYAEDIELRYRGIENVVLYARGEWEQNDGNLDEAQLEPALALIDVERSTDIERLSQRYAAGSKYYPVRWMHVSSEYSFRISEYDYDHDLDSTPNDPASGDRYPAFLDNQTFWTHDLTLRATFRLPGGVGLVARYDWIQSTIETEGQFLDDIQSAQTRSHLFGGTLTWNPAAWWWTRAAFNYVLSETDTAANNYGTAVANLFNDFENDYLAVNLATGMAVDDKTDLELTYGWVSADNYRDLSAIGVAYGSRFSEHGVSVRAARRLDDHMKIAVGYGFFNNDEGFAGGYYDYDAHVLTTSFEFEY